MHFGSLFNESGSKTYLDSSDTFTEERIAIMLQGASIDTYRLQWVWQCRSQIEGLTGCCCDLRGSLQDEMELKVGGGD